MKDMLQDHLLLRKRRYDFSRATAALKEANRERGPKKNPAGVIATASSDANSIDPSSTTPAVDASNATAVARSVVESPDATSSAPRNGAASPVANGSDVATIDTTTAINGTEIAAATNGTETATATKDISSEVCVDIKMGPASDTDLIRERPAERKKVKQCGY